MNVLNSDMSSIAKSEILTRVKAAREGGHTERCHGTPHHGSYSVASHTYHALSLLYILYPGEPRHQLVKALLFHDAAERWLGDLPATAKWLNPELGREYAYLERRVDEKFGFLVDDLTEEEILWKDNIDKLELLLWCREQQSMGNQMLLNFFYYLDEFFINRWHEGKLSASIWFVYNNYNTNRLEETI